MTESVEVYNSKKCFSITEKTDKLTTTICHLKNESKEYIRFKNQVEKIREKKQDCYYMFKYPNFQHKIKTTNRQIINCFSLECYIFNKRTDKAGKHSLEYIHPAIGQDYLCSKLALICYNKRTKFQLTDLFFKNLCEIFISLGFPLLLWKEIYCMKNLSDKTKETMIFVKESNTVITIDISIIFAEYFIQNSIFTGLV